MNHRQREAMRQALRLAESIARPTSRGSWNPTTIQLREHCDVLRNALAEPAVEPVDIEDLAHSALQEALSYGLGLDLFVRYFKIVQKASPTPPVEVPLLTDDEIAAALPWAGFDDLIESYSARQLHEALRAIEALVRQKAGLK